MKLYERLKLGSKYFIFSISDSFVNPFRYGVLDALAGTDFTVCLMN